MKELNRIINHLKKIYLKSKRETAVILSEKEKDISISTDKIFHEGIVSFLLDKYDYPVLSEEDNKPKDFKTFSEYYWILDPLDGSFNYFRGIPVCCMSLGLWQAKTPVLGIIFDFNRQEIFVGVAEENELTRQSGCWLNGEPIRVSEVGEMAAGVICTGFHSYRNFDKSHLEQFISFLQKWKKVRLLGSAALSLAWVAAGRTDAYMEEDIRIWDVAGGLAVVRAAGGDIFFKARPRSNTLTVGASNAKIRLKDITGKA